MESAARRQHFLPADGNWHRAPWWLEVTAECGPPEIVRAAEAALLAIFPPAWAMELIAGDADTHPFERLWRSRGDIPRLVKLGFGLHLVGSPRELTADLREPSRFATRTSEAWAGAFMMKHGATVEYIDERTKGDEGVGTSKPEFLASIGETRFAVEVKHLDMGEDEQAYMRITNAFTEGFIFGEAEAGVADVPNVGARAVYGMPSHALELLVTDGLEAARAAAEKRGRALGREYVDFLRGRPADGHYLLAPELEVLVGAEHSGVEGSFPFPDLESYVGRLRRNKILTSAKKFRAYSLAGILVLFRPWWPVWPGELIAAVAKILAESKQAGSIAAVIFVDEEPMLGMRWLVDRLRVVPGPAWSELPQSLRARFPPCRECGAMHQRFELLGG